jgi:hypothetical protein
MTCFQPPTGKSLAMVDTEFIPLLPSCLYFLPIMGITRRNYKNVIFVRCHLQWSMTITWHHMTVTYKCCIVHLSIFVHTYMLCIHNIAYPPVVQHSYGKWSKEIVDLQIKHCDVHSYVTNYQRVNLHLSMSYPLIIHELSISTKMIFHEFTTLW